MRYIILITGLVLFSACFALAQKPVFLSPYKDGHPFPDSLKDYSQPVRINLLSGGIQKATEVKAITYESKEEVPVIPTGEEKIVPVQLNNSKNKKSSGKN